MSERSVLRATTPRQAVVRTLNRQPLRRCSRPGCSDPAGATLAFSYQRRVAVLGPLGDQPEPATYDLCMPCADRTTPPRSWQLEDHRTVVEPTPLVPGGYDEASTVAVLAAALHDRDRSLADQDAEVGASAPSEELVDPAADVADDAAIVDDTEHAGATVLAFGAPNALDAGEVDVEEVDAQGVDVAEAAEPVTASGVLAALEAIDQGLVETAVITPDPITPDPITPEPGENVLEREPGPVDTIDESVDEALNFSAAGMRPSEVVARLAELEAEREAAREAERLAEAVELVVAVEPMEQEPAEVEPVEIEPVEIEPVEIEPAELSAPEAVGPGDVDAVDEHADVVEIDTIDMAAVEAAAVDVTAAESDAEPSAPTQLQLAPITGDLEDVQLPGFEAFGTRPVRAVRDRD